MYFGTIIITWFLVFASPIEQGETKEQALIRECREELAITLSVGEVFMDVVHE